MPDSNRSPKYQRIVLKVSGEALRETGSNDNISPQIVADIARQIQEIHALGIEIAVVIGGGNIWRGLSASHRGMERTTADYMGMLATVINGLALQSALEQAGVTTRVQTAIEMMEVAEPFIRRRAERHLEKGRVVIFAAGTGNPFFTTDSAASLRALEIKADVILKATKVDGIYSADPMVFREAVRYDKISYQEVLEKQLKVMDASAISLCMDNNLPIMVFNMKEPGNIIKAVCGDLSIGTLVVNDRQEAQTAK